MCKSTLRSAPDYRLCKHTHTHTIHIHLGKDEQKRALCAIFSRQFLQPSYFLQCAFCSESFQSALAFCDFFFLLAFSLNILSICSSLFWLAFRCSHFSVCSRSYIFSLLRHCQFSFYKKKSICIWVCGNLLWTVMIKWFFFGWAKQPLIWMCFGTLIHLICFNICVIYQSYTQESSSRLNWWFTV